VDSSGTYLSKMMDVWSKYTNGSPLSN